MQVTRLTADGKTKTKIYMDDRYAGWLYNRQLLSFGITEDAEISEEKWQNIVTEEILPRGKKKALDLLLFQERAEKELWNKLLDAGYTEEQTEAIFAYVKKYPYLNDVRYASHMFRAEITRRSKRQICYSLMQKGVSDSDIEEGYELFLSEQAEERGAASDEVEDPELEALRKALRKKIGSREDLSREEWLKVYRSLAGKGYAHDKIKQVLREYQAELDESNGI